MIRLYLKIPEKFVYFIFKYKFWVVLIPFVCIVKFKLLAQLPADHISYPVSLILCSFCANWLHSLIIIIIIIIIIVFSHQITLMVFHWSLSDSKSPQVSRTLLSILAVFNNAVVWMVSSRPPTSKSSSPFSNPLVTVPNEPITIGIIVTSMFHSFFQFPSKV